MHRWLSSAILLGLLVVFLTCPARGQNTPPAKPDPKSAKEPTFGKDFVNAKLVAISDQEITVEFTWKAQVVNKEAADRLAQLQQEYNDAMNIPDPVQRFQKLKEIVAEAREKQKLVNTTETKTDQQVLEFAKDMKVRLARLPEVDAQGKPIKYTDQQLKDLKGPGGLAGYAAKPEDLKLGQMVKVHFIKKKAPDNPFREEQSGEVYYFIATLIIITDQPMPPKDPKKDE
jgi:hypothetical protein